MLAWTGADKQACTPAYPHRYLCSPALTHMHAYMHLFAYTFAICLYLYIHTCRGAVSPCENAIEVTISFTHPLWKSLATNTPFYLSLEFGLTAADKCDVLLHTGWGGRKCWHGHLSHEFRAIRESADAANCLRKKSWQRSEIKCRQLLLCFLELQPGFNIS